jgi:hypothetical protein
VEQTLLSDRTPEGLWAHLDQFFYNPSATQHSATWVRTARQGTHDFQSHFQEFQLHFAKAGYNSLPDVRKIEMLKTTLNNQLLDKLAATYVENEEFHHFVKRCKQIWDNIQWNINIKRPTYAATINTQREISQHQPEQDSMDWQSGPVAAAQFRHRSAPNRVYPHTAPTVQQRGYKARETNPRLTQTTRTQQRTGCFNCGSLEHFARNCPKQDTTRKRTVYSVEVDDEDEDDKIEETDLAVSQRHEEVESVQDQEEQREGKESL